MIDSYARNYLLFTSYRSNKNNPSNKTKTKQKQKKDCQPAQLLSPQTKENKKLNELTIPIKQTNQKERTKRKLAQKNH